MSTTHGEGVRDDGGAKGPERASAEGLGLGRGAIAPPQLPSMGVWGHCPQKILKFNTANLFIFSTISRQR